MIAFSGWQSIFKQKHIYLRTLFIMCSVFMFLNGCSNVSKSKTPKIGFWYTMQKGDSLEKIAVKYAVSVIIIQKKNDIYDPDDLVPGIKIFIPGVRRIISSSSQIKPKTISSKHRFIWPAKGVISSGFGSRHGKKHEGIDITKDQGRNIIASAAGVVTFSGRQNGYGKVIIIKHDNNFSTKYAHNQSLYVKKGQFVNQGKKIAYMGSTGRSSGIHLHFEIRINNKPKNPLRYLPTR